MTAETIGVIVVAIITAVIGPIVVGIVAKLQVAKGIKKISGNLPGWELLYEHDENGNQIGGTISRLIEAVGKAYPIKVKIYQAKDRFDMMDAQWLIVENDLVHASNTSQISLVRDSSGNYIFQSDAYHYFVVVNSEGHHHASRINLDGRKGNPTTSKRRMVWFGLIPLKP